MIMKKKVGVNQGKTSRMKKLWERVFKSRKKKQDVRAVREITDRFGGSATIRALPLTDKLIVAAKIAQEGGKNELSVKLVEKTIEIYLGNFCTKEKDYEGIRTLAERFGISEGRVREIASNVIKAQIVGLSGNVHYAVVWEAARVGKHYGLETEMKEAAIEYIKTELASMRRNEVEAIEKAQEKFELTEDEIKLAVKKAMWSLVKRGFDNPVREVAEELGMHKELNEVVIEFFEKLYKSENYESALRIDELYGVLDEDTERRIELVKKVCETTRYSNKAIEVASKYNLPDQLKEVIIKCLDGCFATETEFNKLIDLYGRILGEQRVKEIAEFVVDKFLDEASPFFALPIANRYETRNREKALLEYIKYQRKNNPEAAIEISRKEGLIEEIRKTGKVIVEKEMNWRNDKKEGYVERVKEEYELTDEDLREAAGKAVLKIIERGMYEEAKNLLERYGLTEQVRVIDEITKVLGDGQ